MKLIYNNLKGFIKDRFKIIFLHNSSVERFVVGNKHIFIKNIMKTLLSKINVSILLIILLISTQFTPPPMEFKNSKKSSWDWIKLCIYAVMALGVRFYNFMFNKLTFSFIHKKKIKEILSLIGVIQNKYKTRHCASVIRSSVLKKYDFIDPSDTAAINKLL
jgi:hypothetical protein